METGSLLSKRGEKPQKDRMNILLQTYKSNIPSICAGSEDEHAAEIQISSE